MCCETQSVWKFRVMKSSAAFSGVQRHTKLQLCTCTVLPAFPYTDTTYQLRTCVQHHQRTSSQQFCNYCCTTNLPHRNARAQHLDMSRCWELGMWQIFVRWWWICCCELVRWWCMYSMSVSRGYLYSAQCKWRNANGGLGG